MKPSINFIILGNLIPPTPESLARENIDAQLAACGWVAQDRARMNLYAGPGIAVREFPLTTGYADYLLFVDRKAIGVIEAKAEGVTLSGVAASVARVARLKQSVLMSAFEGKLS